MFGSFEDDDLSVEERLQLKRILYERKTSELEVGSHSLTVIIHGSFRVRTNFWVFL